MADSDVIQVRGKWYNKTTRRFLGPVVAGEPAPTSGLKQIVDPTDASVDDVMAEVGDDVEKAKRALAFENAKDEPRKTLVSALEKVVHDEGSAE